MKRLLTRVFRAAVVTGVVGVTPAVLAATHSNIVAIVERQPAAGSTVSVTFPFSGIGSEEVRDLVSGSAASGDLLHLWLSTHFVTYSYSDSALGWHILESESDMPEDRLTHRTGQGYLLTRTPGVDDRTLVFSGSAPEAAVTSISVPPMTWVLIGSPYPDRLALRQLSAAGASLGDCVRVWVPDSESWLLFELTEGGWTGPGTGADSEVGVAEAFLYYNASDGTRDLEFTRPYPEASRP